MKCNTCNQDSGYDNTTSYQDMWIAYDGGEHVYIMCPNPTCLPSEALKKEKVNASRYELTFGKHKGKRLTTVDHGYLEWLLRDRQDLLLEACINTLN